MPKVRRTTTEALRVIAYVRVSTDEQASSGAGLDAQRTAVLAEVERRGWGLVRLVEDAGLSARTVSDRPELVAALADLDAGRADVLLAAKLDRITRSIADGGALLDRAQRRGWRLVALDLGIDLTTPSGEMMAGVLTTFAQFERRLIGQRTRDALAARKAAGVRLGRPRQTGADVVARIVAMRDGGDTLAAIAERLTAEAVPTTRGGARWYPSTVAAVLRSAELDAA